jgi:hypothetical protein
MHGDEVVDRMLERARACAGDDLEVIGAAEGLTVTLADPLPDPFATAG